MLEKINPIICLCLGIGCMVSLFPLEMTSLFLIIAIGILLGIFFVIASLDSKHFNFLLSLFLAALLSRVIISLFLYNLVYLHKGTGLFGDGWSYSESGYSILQMWLSGIKDIGTISTRMMKITTSGNLGSYDFWNAIVYSFTGKSPLSLIFINCLAGSLTAMVVYFITKELADEKAGRISSLLAAFWPSTFIWSMQNLKEPLSIFLIVSLVWAFLNLRIKFRFYLIFAIIILSIVLKEFRAVSFFVFYVLVLPFSLALHIFKKNKFIFILLILTVIVVITLLIDLFYKKFLNLFSLSGYSLKDVKSLLEWLNQMRSYRAYGKTAFLAGWDFTNPFVLVLFIPVASIVAWLAPFPWQLGSMSQIMAVPEMISYYMLLPVIFLGMKYVIKNKINEGGIIVSYIFIMMLVLAFVEGNIGTLFRHRALVLPFMFVLAGIGLAQKKARIAL